MHPTELPASNPCGLRREDSARPRYGQSTSSLHLGSKARRLGAIKRELKRRSAIEAVIGHMKTDGHLGRCYLKGRDGDATNAILTAVGHNLRLVLTWLRLLSRSNPNAFWSAFTFEIALKSAS
jgi:transposase, IS5 family